MRAVMDDERENLTWQGFGTASRELAKVIAADGFNKIGITGVSKETRIIPIEAIPGLEQVEKDHDVARAITYAVEQGARVRPTRLPTGPVAGPPPLTPAAQ